ncbi:hypothetical protein Dimus_037609, partial [Dionaea muscipula]
MEMTARGCLHLCEWAVGSLPRTLACGCQSSASLRLLTASLKATATALACCGLFALPDPRYHCLSACGPRACSSASRMLSTSPATATARLLLPFAALAHLENAPVPLLGVYRLLLAIVACVASPPMNAAKPCASPPSHAAARAHCSDPLARASESAALSLLFAVRKALKMLQRRRRHRGY